MLRNLRVTPFSFKNQLLWLITIFSVLLVISNSLVTIYMVSQELKEELEAQSEQLVKNFAEQSILALIYDSKANAALPLANMLNFPNIHTAAIFKPDQSLLDYTGQPNQYVHNGLPNNAVSSTLHMQEHDDDWIYVYAVTSKEFKPNNDSTDLYSMTEKSSEDELFGYVSITVSKDKLKQAQRTIVADNLISSISILTLFFITFLWLIQRLTTPLSKLARNMRQAHNLAQAKALSLNGPLEIQQITQVYNQMIHTLAQQDIKLRANRDQLESEVALRTQELVQARDAALTASRHKSEFLANISHELRTPIQAIIGYTDLVKEELEMQGYEDYAADLQHVLDRSDSLLNLINNILDVTKVEAGKMELKIESTSLSALTHDIKETLVPLIRKNNNTFALDCQGTPNFIDIDHTKIYQIMLNLLSNANKFTENGEIKLLVTWSPTRLYFSVTDNGIGISPENQHTIFNEFQQIDGSLTRKYQGTGLGLTICKRFCQLMGGTIHVESELGQGSSFIVNIPLPLPS